MPDLIRSAQQWVIFRLDRLSCAVPSASVREMTAMPAVRSVPGVPPDVRGLIDLRGSVFPVVDLRLRLGMRSFQAGVDDLCSLLSQREQDHRNWLAKLEQAVNDRSEFTLTTDPHACAFGKWYDQYRPEDPWLASALRKFDAPHQRIHAIGERAKSLMEQNEHLQARELVERTRSGDLAVMVRLFEDLRAQIRETQVEIAMVLEGESGACVAAVDAVESVETLREGTRQPIPGLAASADDAVVALGRRRQSDALVVILDPESVLGGVARRVARAA